jgi:fucose 4-O-acetylase-like acetyltransferase
MPPGPGGEWYPLLKDRLYAFHMPLFMAVSGLVYGLSWKPGASWRNEWAGAGRRVWRLLPSYLLFAIIIFGGKALVAQFSPVDNPVHGVSDLMNVMLTPTLSFAAFLWYVYVLALLYVIFPMMFHLVHGRLSWVFFLSLAAACLPKSYYLAWDKLQPIAMFFVAGVAAGRHHDAAMAVMSKATWPALLLWCCAVFFADVPAMRWLCAAMAVLAIPGLMYKFQHWRMPVLEWLGRYTFIIYLTNTILIGITKLIFERLGLWQGQYLLLFAVCATAAATVVPMGLKRFALPRMPMLDRITS